VGSSRSSAYPGDRDAVAFNIPKLAADAVINKSPLSTARHDVEAMI